MKDVANEDILSKLSWYGMYKDGVDGYAYQRSRWQTTEKEVCYCNIVSFPNVSQTIHAYSVCVCITC